MRWYTASIVCPTDNAPCILRSTAYSADLELDLMFQCPICNENLHWRVYGSALAHLAMVKDMEVKKKPTRAVQPPLAIKPPDFTSDDLKELKAFHIRDAEAS